MKTRFTLLLVGLASQALTAGVASADDPAGLSGREPLPFTSATPPSVQDVALPADGILRGRVIESDGTAIDGARVVIRQKDHLTASLFTDQQGEFSAEGLAPGVYHIESPTASGTYRLWREDAAPPAARRVALVVSHKPTLRGQYGYRTMDLLTLGLGAGGVTLGVLALDKAEDAENQANQAEMNSRQLGTPVSP